MILIWLLVFLTVAAIDLGLYLVIVTLPAKRCHHDWKGISEYDVFRKDNTLKGNVKQYVCTKCGKFKTIVI